jgi:IclR family transcriptional regulator, pca regulon regulatory protein
VPRAEAAPDAKTSGKPDPRYYVETAARTLRLLLAVSQMDEPATLAAIVAELGWSKPAVYRLVRTLEAIGALRQQPNGYVLGPMLITLGQSALQATHLLEVARPYMEDLHRKLDETIVLTVLDGDEVVYVDRLEADKILIPRTRIGSRLPAYSTSTGQVLLASLSDEEVKRRLADRTFEHLAPNTLDSLDALLLRLSWIRREGYAINDEELTIGHRAVAAPVSDYTGATVAAVSVSVPAARVSREQLEQQAVEDLIPAAYRISVGLGAQPQAAFTASHSQ